MIAFFARHATGANVLMMAVLLLGAFALPKLQKDTFPLTPTKNIEVRIVYPGASPFEMMEEVCYPLEDSLDKLSGIKELSCDARENLVIANVEIGDDEDIDTLTSDIQQQVNAINDFPDRVEQITVSKLDRVATVASVAITGNMSDRDLYLYTQQIKHKLKESPFIAQVTVSGFADQEIEIRVSQWKLQQYGLSVSDLSNLVQQQSISTPAGVFSNELEEISVRFDHLGSNVRDFENIVIKSSEAGTQVRLGDVAVIQQKFTTDENQILFNGQRATLLQVSKTQFQDTLTVKDAIVSIVEQEQTKAPEGVVLTITQDSSTNIIERLRILTSNGVQGLALAFLMLWAFFNIRFSFWVTMGLPVSFLGAIFAIQLLGYTLNMMTLVGLIVAIGLLMDDSLIIAENIAAKRQQGLPAFDAAIEGTKQVFPGVIVSFATTIMVIGPLMFLTGNMGEVLRYIPIVLLITLLVSLIEAFLILPFHLAHSHTECRSNPIRDKFIAGFENIRDRFFVPLSVKAMNVPYLSLGILVMVVMISTASISSGWLKLKAMPALESDVLQARILLPQGSLLSQTEVVVEKVANALEELNQEYVEKYPSSKPLVASTTIMFNSNADANESGPHMATVSADLLPAQFRQQSIKELIQEWKQKVGPIADVVSLKFTDKERGIAGNGIDIRVQGESLEQLNQVSRSLVKWLKEFDGVYNLSTDLREGRTEFHVNLLDEAGVMGVNASNVAQTLRAAVKGSTDLTVFQQGELVDISVRLDEFTHQASLYELNSLMVTAANGTLVSLSSVATFDRKQAFSRIHRINGMNTVVVQGNIDTRVANAREIMLQFNNEFVPQTQVKFPDVSFASQGQDKESSETGSSLATFFALGVVGIYLILVFLFQSYTQPIAVLLAIPMGWIGVVWGHLGMGFDLTIPSLVGFATLAGIVVNDNILLVNFIKQNIAQGERLIDACRAAVCDRFRAIFITSLTTFAGLLPLLAETSTQAQFLTPLIASIAFGLVSATLLASIVVPCVLLILDDLKLTKWSEYGLGSQSDL
ncbi:efflux RND transporter permease subunit [Vibrio vulnificus]|uniref:efflux RND transporter permease subunit n=1 Tax=Vibrio vulnificus TaxID=672 RepID=UPI0010298B17|nr:efflux RND transporter permease subunit [Vibrio vulnificus]MCU8152878.1 efflux RND transporter permease subunit [Vibrio vulnificus]RZP86899.1 efflux RND transporter permease subunit [Vibrio vulnificus]